MSIHPTAIVDPSVQLNDKLSIGPFCQIEPGVQLGEGVVLDSHVILKSGTILKDHVHVHSFVCLGDLPQISNFNANLSGGVIIGEGSVIREGATVHKASQSDQNTIIGDHCLLMAYSHVGHDCHVGNHCTLVNHVLLGGFVHVDDFAFLSGGSMVHQFVSIGESAFISGNTVITMHVPPFVTVLERNQLKNLNLIGLQRRGFSTLEVADDHQRKRLINLLTDDRVPLGHSFHSLVTENGGKLGVLHQP